MEVVRCGRSRAGLIEDNAVLVHKRAARRVQIEDGVLAAPGFKVGKIKVAGAICKLVARSVGVLDGADFSRERRVLIKQRCEGLAAI